MHSLWQHKAGLLVSFLLALLAAVSSVEKISVSPPSLTSRSLEMATASTHVVIDTPSSALIDLRQDTYSVEGLRNRTVLLGNVLASTQVQERIAKRAGVSAETIRVQAPLTREMAAPPVDSENARHTTDILKSADQYRVNLQANPTVPMLDIYAQAPNAETAAALANAVVEELRLYLKDLAQSQHTPAQSQIHLVELGRAKGVVINDGVHWQVALLVFALTFAIAIASLTFLVRVRAGWRQAALCERPAGV